MSHWNTIKTNFVACMEADIPGAEDVRFELTEDIIEAEAFPETIVGNAYSLQLASILSVEGEINTIFRTEFLVRLQLTFFLADRADYDRAIETIEAVIRQRIRASTWNGTFTDLRLASAGILDLVARGAIVANADFAVSIQGT